MPPPATLCLPAQPPPCTLDTARHAIGDKLNFFHDTSNKTEAVCQHVRGRGERGGTCPSRDPRPWRCACSSGAMTPRLPGETQQYAPHRPRPRVALPSAAVNAADGHGGGGSLGPTRLRDKLPKRPRLLLRKEAVCPARKRSGGGRSSVCPPSPPTMTLCLSVAQPPWTPPAAEGSLGPPRGQTAQAARASLKKGGSLSSA